MALAGQKPRAARECCYRSALDETAGFCDDCGSIITRCMAFEECGGLVDRAGRCPICVAPEFALDAGAASAAKAGNALALPLVVTNGSPVARPLFVNSVHLSEDGGDYRKIHLPWERLEPGLSADAGLRTGVIEHAGVHRLDLLIGVSTRYLWREECFLFASSVAVPVYEQNQSHLTQNITLNADQIGAGTTIYNPTRIEHERAQGLAAHDEPIALAHRLADKYQVAFGARGYSNGLKVPRTVKFDWFGFGPDQAPPSGVMPGGASLMTFGRASIRPRGGTNDVRTLVTDAEGSVDEELSLQVSRRHFSVYLENDRLMARADSQNGMMVSGKAHARGHSVPIGHGDTISPLVQVPQALALRFGFEVHHDEVARISVHRTSAGRRRG